MQTEDGSGDGFVGRANLRSWSICTLRLIVTTIYRYLPISTPNRIKLQRPVAMEQSTGH